MSIRIMIMLSDVTFAIYGFGRAGRSLCASLSRISSKSVVVFCRQPSQLQLEHAKACGANLYSVRNEFLEEARIREAEILFIAVSDDSIEEVSLQFKEISWLPSVVAHLSGSASSAILFPLKQLAQVAQFHPLVSLDGQLPIPQSLVAINTDDEETFLRLSKLVKRMNCEPFLLKTGKQDLYHAAASITGNLALALVMISQELMEQCGVERKMAQTGLSHLLNSAVRAIEKKDIHDALTGPVARGDEKTIRKHVDALLLEKAASENLKIYKTLSKKLLSFKSTSPEKREKLMELLNEDS